MYVYRYAWFFSFKIYLYAELVRMISENMILANYPANAVQGTSELRTIEKSHGNNEIIVYELRQRNERHGIK